jgi:hypothetical protein
MSLVTEQMNQRLQDKLAEARVHAVDAQRGDPDDWGRWIASATREYGMFVFNVDIASQGIRATLVRAQAEHDEEGNAVTPSTRQIYGVGLTVGAAMVALRKQKREFDQVKEYTKLRYKKIPPPTKGPFAGGTVWEAYGLVNVRDAYSEENAESVSRVTIAKGKKGLWEVNVVDQATRVMYVRHMEFAKLGEAKAAVEKHRNLREYDHGFELLD